MMPISPSILLTAATLLPLLGFIVLLFLGKRMGNPLAGYVGTLMIFGSFVLSLGAMVAWYNGGTHAGLDWGPGLGPIFLRMRWIPMGGGIGQKTPGWLDLGIYVDSLTVAMFNMITLVSLLVHIFSIGYMHEDKRFPRFFTYLGLFCFSMLGLVIGGTLLQLFIFWELVGLCSYLLIGFWYEKKSASNAAIKAFVVNRIGDFGFLIGFGILFFHLGNCNLLDMARYLGQAGQVDGHTLGGITLPNGVFMSAGLLTVMGIGLFFGAVGKSAQFPLHVWLPDAMEGPTPVSALIHAATMVAAGVYLVGRIFPILTPDAKLYIAITGLITLTMAALIAIAQSDIKKVLAFSTLSQLGYMILAMGIGSWVGGLFHLITHAFFKALLFLGSGSVIAAAHHEQELPQYGGLWRKIPVTAITFGIAVLAIAGTPFLSGYYSKDLILAHAGAFASFAAQQHRSGFYQLFFWLPTIIAYVTAFYMMRCWMLTFWGKPRNQHLYDHAKESPVMWFPLVVLAVMSIIGGSRLLDVKRMLVDSIHETERYCQTANAQEAGNPAVNKSYTGFTQAWPVEIEEKAAAPTEAGEKPSEADIAVKSLEESGEGMVHKFVFWAFIVGIGLGFVIYLNGYAVANVLYRIPPLRWIHIWLKNRMYFDELYFSVFVALVMMGSWISGMFDKYVIDGLVNLAGSSVRRLAVLAGLNDKYVVDGAVNGAAVLAQDLGAAVRMPQTGRIRMYVTVMVLAISLGVAVTMVILLVR